MNTEITELNDVNGWVLYDADCPFCTRVASRLRNPLERRQLALLPLQTPWIRATLGLTETELLSEMRLLTRQGKIFGGVDAWIEISRLFWWTLPLRLLARIPPIWHLLDQGYKWIARHRHCVGGACLVETAKTSAPRFFDYLPLVLLPTLTATLKAALAPWIFMWAMAFAIFFGCKWLTYRIAIRSGMRPGFLRRVGYLFAWPGMDAKEFFKTERGDRDRCGFWAYHDHGVADEKAPEDWRTPKAGAKRRDPRDRDSVLDCASPLALSPAQKYSEHAKTTRPHPSIRTAWLLAITKTLFGATLFWGITRFVPPGHPLLTGWVGMIGVIFLIHFGAFHLLQLTWQAAGIQATPVMNNPIKATSLRDFWGARWNTAFNELAFRFGFRPLRRWTTPGIATLLVFLVSGLIHDLLISWPARGGYGLPTLYFLLQAFGIQFERTQLGHRLRLGHGLRGWCFTLFVTAGPAFWLFHPPFIHHVILPMLTAIGAT